MNAPKLKIPRTHTPRWLRVMAWTLVAYVGPPVLIGAAVMWYTAWVLVSGWYEKGLSALHGS